MNTKFRYWVVLCVAVPVLGGVLGGCNDHAMNSTELQVLGVPDIGNFVWTMNRSGYEPVQLIFNAEGFHGYDGCNWFGGRYVAKGDSIFPSDVAQTQRGCTVRTFSIGYLAKPFRLQVGENELRIFSPDGTFTFKSDVTGSLENSPLVRKWVLKASTDPAFTEVQAQNLVPTLMLGEDRTFKISWYCVAENSFGCDEISGVFGIGANRKILFYQAGWKTHAGGLELVERILEASTYTVEMDRLMLANGGMTYQFSAVNR
ncbi:MAG: META domain-containing protein [bacterium]|nr:META domain-containing protein [bacterium]